MYDEAVKARVLAFISDFHAAWQRSGSMPMPTFNPERPIPDGARIEVTLSHGYRYV